jgi:uncharacterized protein YkwD
VYKIIKSGILLTLLLILVACSDTSNSMQKKLVADKNEVNLSPYKAGFINEIANIRAKGNSCGAPTDPLRVNLALEKAAKAHAKDMAVNHFVQHDGSGTATDPARKAIGLGSTFIDRIVFFGYPAKTHNLVGETITYTKNNLVKSKDIKNHFKKALQIILNDPPHCKILMNPRFKHVGIGAYRTKDGYYWSIEYGEVDQ